MFRPNFIVALLIPTVNMQKNRAVNGKLYFFLTQPCSSELKISRNINVKKSEKTPHTVIILRVSVYSFNAGHIGIIWLYLSCK